MSASTQHLPHSFRLSRPALLFLLGWFVLNLLQISLTELTSDEGYYWFYSRRLQWGYYDHPPLVALLIKAGTSILPGELGVRFFNALLNTASVALFFSLLPPTLHTKRTFLLLLAAPLVHYLAFLVFPDGPLLFFTLLFLVGYKRFLFRQSTGTATLLGLALVGMAYAKYHGALVLLFTVLANPRLLRYGYFYAALAVAALLFAPHIWWQYQHGFPTFNYHLSGRTSAWSFRYVGEYLSQQLVAIGPALVFLPFVAATNCLFERTLKFIAIGTLTFFLVSSFKTFVHFHWTSIALFPLLYLGVHYYHNPRRRKLFAALVVPFAVLLSAARLLLLLPLFPALHAGEDYYRGRKAWAAEVKQLAGGRPLFLPNNLREASLYSFYSGNQGVTLYTRPGKKSQYELWGYEDSLQGREVLLLTKHPHEGGRPVQLLDKDFFYSVVPSFQSYYNGISLSAVLNRVASDSISATVTLTNTRKTAVAFSQSSSQPYIGLAYSVEQKKDVRKADGVRPLTGTLAPGASQTLSVSVPVQDLPSGTYQLYFGIRSSPLPDAVLSTPLSFQR